MESRFISYRPPPPQTQKCPSCNRELDVERFRASRSRKLLKRCRPCSGDKGVLESLKKQCLLPLNVIVTIRALPRHLLVDQSIDKLLLDPLLLYKSLLHLQLRLSSCVASTAKTTMKPLLHAKSKIIYDGGIDLLIVIVKNALLHRR